MGYARVMDLGDLVSGSPFVCGPDTDLVEVATVMAARGYGSAGVVDGRTLLGVITERDLVRAIAAGADMADEPVRRWMSTDPDVFDSRTDLFEAAEWLIESGYRHLPVVGSSGDLKGIVSLRDLLASILEALEEE